MARATRRRAVLAAAALAAGGAAAAQEPGPPAVGRPCMVCHGPLGQATQPDTPNLAGQPASYLTAQLRAFRGGTRRHEVMSVIAKPLTDDDIAQLAAWFASVRVEVSAPK
ncbi:cytochrome c [Ideonella sp.]|uniref:c-type cytochrome n=1 Tax=Ideonella sp. TaxID=1929293 RepID=UPI002B4905FB|nr:cytochrome c [Ideonella sp.]HJV68661.1 cytochrome c [Ideonella sp.]